MTSLHIWRKSSSIKGYLKQENMEKNKGEKRKWITAGNRERFSSFCFPAASTFDKNFVAIRDFKVELKTSILIKNFESEMLHGAQSCPFFLEFRTQIFCPHLRLFLRPTVIEDGSKVEFVCEARAKQTCETWWILEPRSHECTRRWNFQSGWQKPTFPATANRLFVRIQIDVKTVEL